MTKCIDVDVRASQHSQCIAVDVGHHSVRLPLKWLRRHHFDVLYAWRKYEIIRR